MLILEAKDIRHDVQGKEILNVDHIQIQKGERIGVVGKNGSGKTTLLNILSGNVEPHQGTVTTEVSRLLLPQLKRMDTTKSGGEITQQFINEALGKKADLLFADEPTTNLDTNHIEMLEKQLKRYAGAIVLVSHDRSFLDSLCTKIWEIKDSKVTVYPGNYSDYVDQREIEINQQQEAYEQYQAKKRQLENAIGQKKEKAARASKSPRNPYYAKKQKKLEKTAKSIKTRIEKLEKVEKVKEEPPLSIDIVGNEKLKNRMIIRIEELEGKIGQRKLWDKTSFHITAGDKLAIIGDNGTGKSTFIKKLLKEDTNIQLSPALKIGYFSQNLDILDEDKTILDNVEKTSNHEKALIRTVLARLHFFEDDVNKKVHVLSGGERVKVAFAKIFLSEINTIILDEPTNFLDIEAVEALEKLLIEYDGTIIFVSHDRRFVERIANRLLIIRNKRMELFEGTYKEYTNLVSEQNETDIKTEELMVIETKITEILSRLSMEPTPELEEEFQMLLKQRRKLQS
ncbi:ribosomal protection-like ABC-F family protein [Ornithinibacillus halophilus]|uniref:Pleuromutilin/lincosamide/streptogramin A transport system ATP-binding/permease protein n=1 Tax=Ornithinibacillus halophilus TaxID=930117 RepID=A0A1M5FJD4_9BACI|nr:ABC-F type ribosomal protection protein [Ornithinibacillus halophilus]SHF91717.1 pleuromutilin/lincosamide/streptogramin A transport system ATP-binding/permease protein [Ornithinibacillus halophilus]